ncbi:hypothetical protein ACFRLW_41645 [Streptomyces sp. NPDC056728]
MTERAARLAGGELPVLAAVDTPVAAQARTRLQHRFDTKALLTAQDGHNCLQERSVRRPCPLSRRDDPYRTDLPTGSVPGCSVEVRP